MARRTSQSILVVVALFWMSPERARAIKLALPADCKVEVRWVCPPFDSDRLRDTGWSGKYEGSFRYHFDVDASGQPWFSIRTTDKTPQQILNPVRQYRFGLSHPWQGMVCLDNGALLFYTDHDLGFISPTEKPAVNGGLPILPFQPIAALPVRHARLYTGANEAIYVVGQSGSGDQEVYLLQSEVLSGNEQRLLRSYRKVFTTSSDTIEAATGDGQTTFVSLGQTIARITSETQTQPDILVHPEGPVRQLAYSPTAGLFYATDSAVGIVGENGAWDFLPLTWAQIALRGDSLYVLQYETWGVFAIDHVSELTQYSQNGQYTLPTGTSPVAEVKDIRFVPRAIDPNEDARSGRESEFERSKIKEVMGVFVLHPTGPSPAIANLTVRWSGPTDLREDGYRRHKRTVHGFGELTPGRDENCMHFAPFEETFYPGTYTMTVSINGIESGRGSFTITGQTTLHEAMMQDNVPLIERLLEQGADPDQRDSKGQTPLFVAAFHGSTEATRLLLKHGAKVNVKDDEGENALFSVVRGYDGNPTGALETAALLIEHGLDFSAKNNDEQTVLDRIYFNYEPALVNVIDVLLSHGLEVDARDEAGQTRLARLSWTYVGSGSAAPMARCLIRHGADITAVDNDGTSVFSHIAGSDRPELVALLLAHGADPGKPDIDPDGNKRFPLVRVNPRTPQILELLLSHGADPDVENSPGYTALSKAIHDAELEAVRILLAHGASVTADCQVRYQNGSALRGALASYLQYAPKDRIKAQKAKDIFFMLLAHGAQLRPGEEVMVVDKQLHGWLPPQFILDILQRNDQAVLDARDLTDPRLQRAVISRLLGMAQARTAQATSKEGYQAALALCDQAKTRAQIWRVESQCPLIYYNMGLLYGQIGQVEAAKDNFRRYLDLAPNAQDADAIRKSMNL